MSEQDKDDQQFEASPQKLQRARDQGDIPRSTEANTALMYLGAWLAVGGVSLWALRTGWAMAARAMGAEGWSTGGSTALAVSLGQFASLAVAAMIGLPAAVIILGLIAQRGIVFSAKKIAPDIKKINPFRNAKQKFGKSGLTTFAVSASKALFVGLGGYVLFRALAVTLTTAGAAGPNRWVAYLGETLGRVMLLALVLSVAFGALDYLLKWREHLTKNRMTRREVEDEHKESEGDPHLKQARRQKAIDIAMSQMLADVETADVIIVNPTHYAVALKWSRGSGRAPVCVAKGVDEIAARIRERAGQHKVPIWSDPPCARALHATVDIGREILPDHYRAVATAIRFAEKMRARARAGW